MFVQKSREETNKHKIRAFWGEGYNYTTNVKKSLYGAYTWRRNAFESEVQKMRLKDIYKVGDVLLRAKKHYDYREQKEEVEITEMTVSKVGAKYVYVEIPCKNYQSYTAKTEIYINRSGVSVLRDEYRAYYFKSRNDFSDYQEYEKLMNWFEHTARSHCRLYSFEQLRAVKEILESDKSEVQK